MGKASNEICYYCGRSANNREHVPPRQMFKGFECDSITVPSCTEHNCTKSGEDQAIVNVFLLPFKNLNKKYEVEFSPDVVKAVKMAGSSFERTKYRVMHKPFLEEMPEEIKNIPDIGFLLPPIKIKNWIKKLTAGIVYDGIQHLDSTVNWDHIDCWSLEYYDSKLAYNYFEKIELLFKRDKLRKWLESKKWYLGWSSHPRKYPDAIYSFSFCFEFNDITIKHSFYKNYNWYASFNGNQKMSELLINKCLTS